MTAARPPELERVLAAIRACRHCVEAPHGYPLPHEPRPVLRASAAARLAVCSQAPGTKVHRSGTPFTDRSGDRLRDWMGVSPQEFYDESRVAIVPMGFCFPGQNARGSDLPPRKECARLWHARLFAALPRLELVLAVGTYAQSFHLGEAAGKNLQETMRAWRSHLRRKLRPRVLPLPHPSWRNNAWLTNNPWFEADLLPVLRREVATLLSKKALASRGLIY
jgi:uracil-DNA glycosylase